MPKELQLPVKEAINTIKKSFENGGLRKAINTVKTLITNLSKTITNISKVVIPPFAKAIDFVADNLNVLLPLAASAVTAWKSWQVISSVTALIKSHAAAVTAESLAEASSIGTITLKQIAVGALTGEISLATAAQYAWNMAMSLNPAAIVLTGITALTAGITAFSAANGDATKSTDELARSETKLQSVNDDLGSSYEDIGTKFSDFMSDIKVQVTYSMISMKILLSQMIKNRHYLIIWIVCNPKSPKYARMQRKTEKNLQAVKFSDLKNFSKRCMNFPNRN